MVQVMRVFSLVSTFSFVNVFSFSPFSSSSSSSSPLTSRGSGAKSSSAERQKKNPSSPQNLVKILRGRWPKPEIDTVSNKAFTAIGCFKTLDETFVADRIYRLSMASNRSARSGSGRLCMLRIPTHVRIYFLPPIFRSPKTYARVIAGSSQVYAPLASQPITTDVAADDLGPWIIPCDYAYLQFLSFNPELDMLDFVLGNSEPADRHQVNRTDCDGGPKHGINFALDIRNKHKHVKRRSLPHRARRYVNFKEARQLH